MFAKSVAVFALLFAGAASAAQLQINTPGELKECQDVTFTWSDGQPKFLLALVNGDKPCDDAIHEFDESSQWTQSWKVNVPAGTKVQPVIIDSTGYESWGGVITVQPGDTSCIPGAKVESVAPTTTGPPPKASPTSSKLPTTSAAAGVANVEAGTNNADMAGSTAASSFVISSAAVAGVIGAAAFLL